MADEPEELILDTEIEAEEPETPEAEAEPEFVIDLDSDEPADLPNHLRKEIRERDRRLAAYEQTYGTVVRDPGARPVYGDGSEWDFDEVRCDAAIDKWIADDRAFQRQQDTAKEREAVTERENNARQTNYFTKMAVIPLPQPKKDAAQSAVISVLSETQQASILRYAKDPAKMVVALGSNPKSLSALAGETDLGAFILRMADMERNMKVNVRGKLPAPESETIQRGSAPTAKTSTTKAEDALLAKGDIDGYRKARAARMAA